MEKCVTMTSEELSMLRTYILLSTGYRKGEAEAWERLSTETNDEGAPRYKHAASNAGFWREMDATLDQILKKIDV